MRAKWARLAIAGRPVELAVERPARARRLRLRVDAVSGRPTLVLPRGVGLAEGLDFAADHADWLAQRLAAMPEAMPFAHGSVVPYLGEPHRLVHGGRGAVRRDAGTITVGGRPEHMARRLTDWFRAEARRELAARARAQAALVGRTVASVTVRDTRSRWGSCSAGGRLSFSWRLIMAPEWVRRSVVCHEVAHLVEAGHGPAFRALVRRIDPDPGRARAWLKAEGPRLLRYGRDARRIP
jgi:predicted metal-dependent hydrolase